MFSAISPFQEILSSESFRVFPQFDSVAIPSVESLVTVVDEIILRSHHLEPLTDLIR
jgi:hypothetical protein